MTRVLFIAGIGRSGSTLLERALGELPQACALGEVANLWQRMRDRDERCGCRARLADCDFWHAIGERAYHGWDRLDLPGVIALQAATERIRNLGWLGRARLAGPRRAMVDRLTGHYHRVYRAAAELTGARVLIDSSKSPGLLFCLRWACEVDLRVVHLVRDPRGVAYSFTRQVARPEAERVAWMPRRSPAAAALHWNTHNLAVDLWRRAAPVPVRRIHYEQLVADPVGTVREVGALAGLDLTPADLGHLRAGRAQLSAGHSIAGNPMRFTVGEVPLRPDAAWHTGLPPGQRRLVTTICAPLLVGYGYPVNLRPPGSPEALSPTPGRGTR